MATEAKIVDLGGVTDPRIGRLAGGHTDRPLSAGLFSDRDVDTWVVRAWDRSFKLGDELELLDPVYRTDYRLLRSGAAEGMRAVAVIPLEGTGGQYVIARLLGETATTRPSSPTAKTLIEVSH
jgi:hypothetical protein